MTDTPAQAPQGDERSGFDRFAASVSATTSRPTFFMSCLLLVTLWLLEGIAWVVVGGVGAFLDEKYQIQINTLTTILSFLMLALLQNAQQRFENSTNAKLNAMADGLASFMEVSAAQMSSGRSDLEDHAATLRRAVGAEGKVGT